VTDPQPSAYRATADDWLNAETMAAHDSGNGYYALRCILELRARVEALEAFASCPHIRSSDEGTSYCALAEQTAAAPPAALSDALIKAECALADIAEVAPVPGEPDPMKWAERRCAEALAIIRPVMRQHKIRTSEWPGCGFNPPEPAPAAAPAPAGGLVERVTAAVNRTVICSQERNGIARAAIREVAEWFRTIAPRGSEAWRMAAEVLEQEAVHHPQTEQPAAPAPTNPIVEQVRQDLYFMTQRGARKAIREMATVGYSANPFNPVSEQAKHHGWLAAFAWLEQKANQ
jgi:hypothetical protein